jgi:hypothetical protein
MMSQNELNKNRASKKKQIADLNRKTAWITLAIFILMNLAGYGDYYKWADWLKTPSIILTIIFTFLLLIHSGFSVYLFGFPKFKFTVRVVHIYIGYFLFIFTFLSQSIIGIEPYHIIAYTLNWIFVIAHVTLSIRFAINRNVKKQPEPTLNFRGE